MARKGENIYRRKDGRWEGRYIKTRCPDGRAKYGSVYGRTYAEAKKKLLGKHTELLLVAREQPQEENLPSGCFGLVARQWLASARKNIKKSTFNKYADFLEKHILPCLGKMEMMAVTEQALEKLAAEKLEKGRLDRSGGLSPKTVADMLSVIKQVFRYAKLAAPSVRLKSAPQKMAALSRYEQQCLTATLFREMDLCKLGTLLCLHTGIRVGELCALAWRDIDLREMPIGKALVKSPRPFLPALTVRAPFDAHGDPSYFVPGHPFQRHPALNEFKTYLLQSINEIFNPLVLSGVYAK